MNSHHKYNKWHVCCTTKNIILRMNGRGAIVHLKIHNWNKKKRVVLEFIYIREILYENTKNVFSFYSNSCIFLKTQYLDVHSPLTLRKSYIQVIKMTGFIQNVLNYYATPSFLSDESIGGLCMDFSRYSAQERKEILMIKCGKRTK